MKKTITLFVIIQFLLVSNAQIGIIRNDYPLIKNSDSLSKNPIVSINSSAFVIGNKQNQIYGTSISPILILNSHKKFSYGFGTQISIVNSSLLYNSETKKVNTQTYYQNSIFIFGRYKASDKIEFSGYLYQNIPLGKINKANENIFMQNDKAVSVDLQYKISEKSFIHIGLDYQQGNFPSFNNSRYRGFNTTPFFSPNF